MKNAELWKSRSEAMKMFDRYVERVGSRVSPDTHEADVLDWLFKRHGDPALAYDIGCLVQVSRSGGNGLEYATVRSWTGDISDGQWCFNIVVLRFADGTEDRYAVTDRPYPPGHNQMSTGDIRLADIPNSVIALIESKCAEKDAGVQSDRIRENCPFRESYKTPVPPCLKKEVTDGDSCKS